MGGLVDPPPAQAIGLEKAPDISADTLALKWLGIKQGSEAEDHLGELETGLLKL